MIDTDALRERILGEVERVVERELGLDAIVPDRVFELATDLVDEIAALDEEARA